MCSLHYSLYFCHLSSMFSWFSTFSSGSWFLDSASSANPFNVICRDLPWSLFSLAHLNHLFVLIHHLYTHWGLSDCMFSLILGFSLTHGTVSGLGCLVSTSELTMFEIKLLIFAPISLPATVKAGSSSGFWLRSLVSLPSLHILNSNNHYIKILLKCILSNSISICTANGLL